MGTIAWIVWNIWYYAAIVFVVAVPVVWFVIKAYVVLRLFLAFFRVANRKQG